MPRPKPPDSDSSDLGDLIDTTAPLPKNSKRTARTARRTNRRLARAKQSAFKLLSLPYELILEILSHCLPSDIFRLSRTHKALHSFIWSPSPNNQTRISTAIISWRYPSLAQSYRLPIPLTQVSPLLHDELTSPERKDLLGIHRKPYYQHIPTPDPTLICTCLTCMLRWNILCIAIDFAHWQDHLDAGIPIPIIPRNTAVQSPPAWNVALLARNAAIVEQALLHPLWHARILEAHLKSTVRAIRRHAANKGNQRKRFEMSEEDVRTGDDAFLGRRGPASWEVPFHRDNYYMLEAYVPNRSWVSRLDGEEGGGDGDRERGKVRREEGWRYLPEEMHERDLIWVEKRAEERRKRRDGGGDQRSRGEEKSVDEKDGAQQEHIGSEMTGANGGAKDNGIVQGTEVDDAAVIEEVLVKAMKLNLVDTTISEPRESIFGS